MNQTSNTGTSTTNGTLPVPSAAGGIDCEVPTRVRMSFASPQLAFVHLTGSALGTRRNDIDDLRSAPAMTGMITRVTGAGFNCGSGCSREVKSLVGGKVASRFSGMV